MVVYGWAQIGSLRAAAAIYRPSLPRLPVSIAGSWKMPPGTPPKRITTAPAVTAVPLNAVHSNPLCIRSLGPASCLVMRSAREVHTSSYATYLGNQYLSS